MVLVIELVKKNSEIYQPFFIVYIQLFVGKHLVLRILTPKNHKPQKKLSKVCDFH